MPDGDSEDAIFPRRIVCAIWAPVWLPGCYAAPALEKRLSTETPRDERYQRHSAASKLRH